jgi:hypothetical protein
VTDALLAGVISVKSSVKRYMCILVGNVLWDIGKDFIARKEDGRPGQKRFAETMLPALIDNLKNVEAISPNTTSGVFEGYVSIAVLLGPMSEVGDVAGW